MDNLAIELWKAFNVQKREDISYYNTSEGSETEGFAMCLGRFIREEMTAKGKDGITFLCIGTGRSTGGSLGFPMGHMLRNRRFKGAAVIGTLDKPIHATNLDLYVRYIRLHYPNYAMVAIDASMENLGHAGYATLGRGMLQSRLGMSKELRAMGDIVMTRITGGMGSRDPVMLQSVRLSMVMRMADCICESISFIERLWENVTII